MGLSKTLGAGGYEVELDPAGGALARVVTDASGNTVLVGADGNQFSPANSGYRTVLFGDSMTDWYDGVSGILTATYDQATGVITLGEPSHGLWTGKVIDLFRYTPASIRNTRRLPVTRISSSSFSVTLPDKPTDMPTGTATVLIHHNNRHDQQSFVHWWQLRNGQKLNIVNNAAHSADPTSACLDRVDAEVLAYYPDVVIMQSPGINTQNAPAAPTTYTVDEMWAELEQLYTKLCNGVPIVIVGTITPPAPGESRATLGTLRRVIELNRRIVEFARTHKNMHVFDTYSVIVDPVNTIGAAQPSLLSLGDFIHYNARGGINACKELEKITDKIFPPMPSSLPKSIIESHEQGKLTGTVTITGGGTQLTITNTGHSVRAGERVMISAATPSTANGVYVCDSINPGVSFTVPSTVSGSVTGAKVSTARNLSTNPLLTITTGGTVGGTNITGVAASGVACSAQSGTPTAVASVAAASHGFGNEQLLVVSAAVLDDRPKISSNWFGGAALPVLPGRSYQMEALFRVASANWTNTPVSELYFEFSITMADGAVYSVKELANWDGTSAVTIAEDMTLHLKFPVLDVPNTSTITGHGFNIWLRAGGAWTSALTMGLSRIAVNDVTP